MKRLIHWTAAMSVCLVLCACTKTQRADYPIQELDGKTPLQAADTPNMDRIASCRVGLVRTIPDGMEPGSDVANLSLLGYDPRVYHTRRAPFEAASMQVELKPDEVAFRMNLVSAVCGAIGKAIAGRRRPAPAPGPGGSAPHRARHRQDRATHQPSLSLERGRGSAGIC